jgi:hypothetical protein
VRAAHPGTIVFFREGRPPRPFLGAQVDRRTLTAAQVNQVRAAVAGVQTQPAICSRTSSTTCSVPNPLGVSHFVREFFFCIALSTLI